MIYYTLDQYRQGIKECKTESIPYDEQCKRNDYEMIIIKIENYG